MLTNKAWGGWSHCIELKNRNLELIVTTDVGPRIISLCAPGQQNMMCVVPETSGLTGGDEWHIFGGHRLWHSPEAKPRSYAPDNGPVEAIEIEGGVKLVQPTEQETGIRKEIEITLHPEEARVRVLHRMVNEGPWPVRLAVWALTVMAPGGLCAAPQTRRDTGLLPNRHVTLWPYAGMGDKRAMWGDRYILLRNDPNAEGPFKYGISNEEGWGAYFVNDQLFVKHFAHNSGSEYPDYGCSFETYTCDFMHEVESLSPLVTLEPGAKAEHLEKWELFANVAMPEFSEAAVDAALKGRVLR